ncbi:AFG1/ZapE family ATPase [Leptospira santarosai]|uniref:AFG1/ZapE family ATPase n=1 Tax=Leptospira santarosai TaxID=28183 RepID=UPI0026E2A08B|nr:AFG1/ZapE family ATPase [Leptospira santarosai]MDO6383394.1 ATP-binding protein [Leptospira santarosai]
MALKDYIPNRSGSTDCKSCAGVGFDLIVGPTMSTFSLCDCISESCPCGGKAPWLVYEPTKRTMVSCACNEARINMEHYERLFKYSGIPPKYRFRTLDRIDHDSSIGASFTIAHDWASELVINWNNAKLLPQGLFLWGIPGTGKTLLACAILNELIFRYKTNCKHAKINRDFLDRIRNSYQKGSEIHGMEKNIEREFAEVEVLVLDDFGVQKESDWSNSKLYDLIDARYEQGRITIITSNNPPSDLKGQGSGRVYSRLREMTCQIHLNDVADYREKLALQ